MANQEYHGVVMNLPEHVEPDTRWQQRMSNEALFEAALHSRSWSRRGW